MSTRLAPQVGGVCVCDTLGVKGGLSVFSAGGLVAHASTSPTKRLVLNADVDVVAHRRTCVPLNC